MVRSEGSAFLRRIVGEKVWRQSLICLMTRVLILDRGHVYDLRGDAM